MEQVVEYEQVVIPFRAFFENILIPSAVEWHAVDFGPVPRGGIFGQHFQYEQRPDKRPGKNSRVNPHAVPPRVGICP
jgi:hypothetical protein